jgi:methionyl-tRNA synthetase
MPEDVLTETLVRVLFEVEDSLAFALTQLCDHTQRSLVCTEFWHALNRRGVVKNEYVEGRIRNTLSKAIRNTLEEENSPCATCHVGGDECRNCDSREEELN